ncbi:gastric triacylglycerol lipase isoform X3 [Tetranychus urticae]|uniref:gastric triacylglycerol lipase isoform X3 n=1 Tax=Tetranychus urticae TaxID=32264 RepID=UPI000D6570EC|nr:gastric triacylglycerol lipase isoform X3 [Tetranychus urticae]
MNSFKLVSLLLSIFVHSATVNCDSNDPDYKATIEELIESRGFNYEKHYIETKDGYILGVYRLINPFVDQSSRSKLKPIVLQHGFLGVGSDFLINAPGGNAVPCNNSTDNYSLSKLNSTENNNLGFLLGNLCYDVWISNSRGNGYSRNHTTLNPDIDGEFWKFSIDELIAYDTPAVIDYILNQTGFSSLGWIGHSQGTMIMFGLLSEKPEYSAKVKPFIALAPVFYVQHLKMILKFAAKIPFILSILKDKGGELADNIPIMTILDKLTCPKWDKVLCFRILYPILGYNLEQINKTRVDVYRNQKGSGSSLWNLVHFGQNVNSGDFHKFDFGKEENQRRYGQPKPPVYKLDDINSTSIALLYSKSDDLGDQKDVEKLIETLKVPLLRDHFIPLPSWNHFDFLYAKDSYQYVNSVVIGILSSLDWQ